MHRKKSMHLGEAAIELGILDATSQVASVRAKQQDSHLPLGQLLASLGMMDPETLDRELKHFRESQMASASKRGSAPTSEDDD